MIDGSENAIVSWLLNFRIRMFVKSAVIVFKKPCNEGLSKTYVRMYVWYQFIKN